MRVLIACERSGVIRRAFAWRGHYVVSVDLAPAEDGARWGTLHGSIGQHYVGSIFDFLDMGKTGEMPGEWDLLIAHPPCQYLSSSGLHWNKRVPGRKEKTRAALSFALALLDLPVKRKAIENPIGRFAAAARERGERIQTIQPYQFGHDASKATCLVLQNLPDLKPTKYINPRLVCCGNVLANDDKYSCPNCHGENRALPRWDNQTNSGQNKLGPSDTRAMDRARTYRGIADAMADQWGCFKQEG